MSLSLAQEALQRGQDFETRGDFASALACYNEALTQARAVRTTDPEARRLLGVLCMNRGNALQRQDAAANHAAALQAYDEAIAFFESLPFDDAARAPLYRNHLGAAWLNRGHGQIGAGDFAAAAENFERAIAQLKMLPLEQDANFRLNLAGAYTNLAHVRLDQPNALPDAVAAARDALALLVPVERAHAAFAEMSLRARRALVMALGRLMHQPISVTAELQSEATDVIEDGLALAHFAEEQGVQAFRPLAFRLFRLGAQLYRTQQPQFLAEFVEENLAFADDPEFVAAADEALTGALAAIEHPKILKVGDAASERALALTQALRDARQRLAEARARPPSPAGADANSRTTAS